LGVTFATAKKLPPLTAGTAAILVRRIAGLAKYIEQREGVYRHLRRSGLQIHLTSFLASCASYRQWAMGWLTFLNGPPA